MKVGHVPAERIPREPEEIRVTDWFLFCRPITGRPLAEVWFQTEMGSSRAFLHSYTDLEEGVYICYASPSPEPGLREAYQWFERLNTALRGALREPDHLPAPVLEVIERPGSHDFLKCICVLCGCIHTHIRWEGNDYRPPCKGPLFHHERVETPRTLPVICKDLAGYETGDLRIHLSSSRLAIGSEILDLTPKE